jgi:hypothetical protein
MTEQEFIDQFINAPYAALPQPGPAPLPHVFMGDPSARFNPPPQLPSGGFLNPGMPFTSLGQFQGGLTQNQAYNQVTSVIPKSLPLLLLPLLPTGPLHLRLARLTAQIIPYLASQILFTQM